MLSGVAILVVAVSSAGLSLSTESGKPVLSWDAVQGAWDHLEIRGSVSDFAEDAPVSGALLARIAPRDAGNSACFPTSFELAGSFAVDPAPCIACQLCVMQCPVSAISMVDGKAWIDPEKCIACGLCVSSCPVSAIFAPTSSSVVLGLYGVHADGSAELLGTL